MVFVAWSWSRCLRRLAAGLGLAVLSSSMATAQPVADFYRGKTLNLLIGVGVGGEYDTQARLIGRYIGKYVPGSPNVQVQNMIGASGLKMANHLYTQVPRDGSYIGMLSNNLPMREILGDKAIQFEAAKFYWIGSMSPLVEVMIVWSGTGVTTIEDARKQELVSGTSGKGSVHYIITAVMNDFLGTKFKQVTGYESGGAMNLALERGEIHARVIAWSALKVTKPNWLSERKINILAQAGSRAPDLPNVPTLEELAHNDEERQVIELLSSADKVGRPLTTTPDVPLERVQALRAAFLSAMKDTDLLRDAEGARMDVEPISGEQMQKIVENLKRTPQAAIERARKLYD